MHELSIALEIIDIVEEYARKAEAGIVREIEIEVGTLSGVVIEALEFALDAAVENTILEKADRRFIEIPAMGRCGSCGIEFGTDGYPTRCPECAAPAVEIINGRELRVKSLTVDSV